jgi:hypothetical protein
MQTNYEFLNPFRKNWANIRLLLNSLGFVSLILEEVLHPLGTICVGGYTAIWLPDS